MKYIKSRLDFINESFDSVSISKTLSFLTDKVGKSSRNKFLNTLKQINNIYEYPIDKINDNNIKYLNKKNAINVKYDGELNNKWGIYCLKFWFSVEKGYLGYTATSNKLVKFTKRTSDKYELNNRDINYLKERYPSIENGKLIPITDYSKLKTGDVIVGMLCDYYEERNLTPAILYEDGRQLYAIQGVADGSRPDNIESYSDFGKYGTKSWNLGTAIRPAPDHGLLYSYVFDDKPLHIETKNIDESDNIFEWNLPVGVYGDISSWGRDESNSISTDNLNDAEFAIVLYFEDLFTKDVKPSTSEIKNQRLLSKSGATKLMSDEQIRNINIDRYLTEIFNRFGIKSDKIDIKNIQKIVNISLNKKYSLISLISGAFYIDEFVERLVNLIRCSDGEKEYYYERVFNSYKQICDSSRSYSERFEESLDHIKKEHSDNVELINLIDKFLKIGNVISNSISSDQINTVEDLKVMKSKFNNLRSLMESDKDFNLPSKVHRLIRNFYSKSHVSAYISDISTSDIEKTNKILDNIERAVKSIFR